MCVLWLGRCEGSTQKHCCLLTLRSGSPQSPHQPLGPTSRAPVQRESRTVRPISLAFLGVQQTVGRQSTRATPVDIAPGRLQALASASPRLIKRQRCWRVDHRWWSCGVSSLRAPLEPRGTCLLAGDRFDNASSKFRWNPSPLLPFTLTEKNLRA